MSIERLNLTQIVAEIRRNLGESVAARSHITSTNTDDTNIYRVVNRIAQQLPKRLGEIERGEGRQTKDGCMYLDCWRTPLTALTTEAAGDATLYLPVDYGRYIAFYDNTGAKTLRVVENVDKWHVAILKAATTAATPKAIEIYGYETKGANFVRRCEVYPGPTGSVTPSVSVTYWRIPAKMDGASPDSAYPDIDPVFQDIFIYEGTKELMRKDDPMFSRFDEKSMAMLANMAYTARAA